MNALKYNEYYLWGCTLLAILIAPFVHSQTITNRNSRDIEIIEPWKPVTIKLMRPDSAYSTGGQYKISEIKASVADYKFNDKPQSGIAASLDKFPILKIDFSDSKKIYFVDPEHTFYVFDGSDLKGYTIGPGVLIWSSSYLAVAETEGDDAAVARFEKSFNSQKLNDEWDRRRLNRINLSQAASRFYFSDGPYPGGGTPMPELVEVGMTNNVLLLDIQNPATKIVGDFWINLKEKEVTKSVVDGQEMNLNTGKSFASPFNK